MMNKIREYLNGKNLYRKASAVILFVSVVVICLTLKDESDTEPETDIVSTENVQSVAEDEAESYMISEESETCGSESVSESAGLEERKEEEYVALVEESVMPESTEAATEDAAAPPLRADAVVEQEPAKTSKPTPTPNPVQTPKPTPEPIATSKPEISEESIEESQPQQETTEEVEPDSVPTPTETPQLPEVQVPEEHVHSWLFESWYQEPTCSNGGLACEICVSCGETQVTQGTPTGKHNYEIEVMGDCCSEEIQICQECNHRMTGEKDSKNHIDVEDGFCYGCGQKAD